MRKLIIPDGVEWELIVVNNNSTDDTDEVIARHCGVLPIRRVLEKRQGQCHARNAAIELARGEYLIWTDDDVLVDAEWLKEYIAAFARWPQASIFGGRIDPLYETSPPGWVTSNFRELSGMLVVRDLGDEERCIKPGEEPFGANMSFSREAFSKVRFDPNIGLCGDNHIRGDETQLIAQLMEGGSVAVWVPRAKVQHFIPRARMTLKFFWKFYAGAARTNLRLDNVSSQVEGIRWRGVPRFLYRQLYTSLLLAYLTKACRSARWLHFYRQAAVSAGMIEEFRVLAGQSGG